MCPQSEVYKKSVATSVLAIKVPLSLFISLSMPLPRLVQYDVCMYVCHTCGQLSFRMYVVCIR